MIDEERREKVIEALKRCIYDPDPGQVTKEFLSCSECPYLHGYGCTHDLMRDALALLKEQEVHRDGYWIEDAKTYPGAELSNYVCSNCGKTGGTWIKHIAPGRTFPWCPFCGSNMSREAVKWDD